MDERSIEGGDSIGLNFQKLLHMELDDRVICCKKYR